MLNCRFSEDCYFINYTIKHSAEFITKFTNNFCKGHYKQCAIWKVLNSIKNNKKIYQILPFEHSLAIELLEEENNK